MGDWISVRSNNRVPTVMPSVPGSRSGSATGRSSREVTVGGGHASGELGWIHFGLGDVDAAEVRVRWPDGQTGPWLELRANRFATIERGATQPVSGSRRADGRSAWPTARLAEITLPDFGMSDAMPRSPPTIYTTAWSGLRARADEQGYDHARRLRRPRTQRQPRVPHRVRPALRGGDARRRRVRRAGHPGRQRVLRHGRSRSARDAASPVPGLQPARPAARSLQVARARSFAAEGIRDDEPGRGDRLEGVRRPRRRSRSRRSSSTSSGGWRPSARSTNAGALLIDAADGLRVINEVEQLAAFEYASCRTSHGVRKLLLGSQPGMRE